MGKAVFIIDNKVYLGMCACMHLTGQHSAQPDVVGTALQLEEIIFIAGQSSAAATHLCLCSGLSAMNEGLACL